MTYTIQETNLERQHLLARFLEPMTVDALQSITLPPNAMILDIGCGLGDTSLLLHQQFPSSKVTGLDADASLVEAAIADKTNLYPQLHFMSGDGLHLPFEDNHFDFVFCRFVLHHIPDATAVLGEMKRVCKPGGIVFAQEPDVSPFQPYPENQAYLHYREYVNTLFADAIIGRKLISYFKSLSIEKIEHKAEVKLSDSAADKRFFTLTSVALGGAILQKGLLDEESLADWLREVKTTEDHPDAVILSFPVISVWGRKE